MSRVLILWLALEIFCLGSVRAAGWARQRPARGAGAPSLAVPAAGSGFQPGGLRADNVAGLENRALGEALDRITQPNLAGESLSSGGEEVQQALQGAKPAARYGEVQIPEGTGPGGSPRLSPASTAAGSLGGPAASRPRIPPAPSGARGGFKAALLPGLALGANVAAWAWGAPNALTLALAGVLAVAAGRWLYRSLSGPLPALDPPSDEDVRRAAQAVIELKGGLVTPLLWLKLADHKAWELQRRGAAPEQLELFHKLCREAPIQPGGFRPSGKA